VLKDACSGGARAGRGVALQGAISACSLARELLAMDHGDGSQGWRGCSVPKDSDVRLYV
jgi:hypothetical protein